MSAIKLEALLNAAADAIISIDGNGIILQANPAASILFGYEQQAFLGRNVAFLMPDHWASLHDGFIRNYERTGENRIIGIGREVEGKRRDGTTFPIHLAVSKFEVEGERFYTGIIHDLTRRRKAENALMRAQKMESIGHLTGGIAHDFNNLLTVIIGNLELLDLQLTEDLQRTLVKEATDAAELGADLTSRLLAFASRSMLQPKVLSPNELVEELASLLRRAIGGNAGLTLRLTEEVWQTRVDPGQMESVLLNLVVNARDAMPEGGEVILETRNTILDTDYAAAELGVLPGDYVCITVTDNGEGIAADNLARVFEPFFTTKTEGKGTGLGLSMVWGFAEQSAGKATIYSEPGVGTSVSIYLPRYHDDTERPGFSLDQQAIPQGHSELILVVEDNEQIRKLTVKRLTALGYRTRTAENAATALSVLGKENGIAMMFTDMIMPGGTSGLELARQVRVNRPELPILLTSGYAGVLVERDKELEFPLLRKPYRQDDLAIAFRNVLRKNS